MTFGFALVLAGFILLDAGWKGTTPAGVLRGATAGSKGAGGVLAETGKDVLASFSGSSNSGGVEVPRTKGTKGTSAPGSKGYVNPFGPGATSGRIDQGKDVGGSGPVKAIGNARILKTGAPGWPGGEQGVLYQLLDGPAKGKIIYVYEGIRVRVHAGQTVKAGHVIGEIIPGTETGIEMGWADANGVPLSHGEYTEGLETVMGKAFTKFLASLGFK